MKFSDAFKDSKNWTTQEVVSLLALMIAQSAIDGEVTKEEGEVMSTLEGLLPSNSGISSVQNFIERASNLDPQVALETLKGMHSLKKKVVLVSLAVLGAADGDFDEDEQMFGALVGKSLGLY